MEDIRGRREEAENWDRARAEDWERASESIAQTDEVLRRAKEGVAEMWRRYPSLAPSAEQQSADRMRERAEEMKAQADEMEFARVASALSEKKRKEVPVLQRCETHIREKLR